MTSRLLAPLLTPLLAPLELLYASRVRARNARFDRAELQRLSWPVVSIGSLSVGGAGKTPLVICLARLLASEGWHADVLSRGYGRTSRATARVDPAGRAEQFGDEPLLIARAAGVPVYVGASRYQAGRRAERAGEAEGPRVHLLDDGFQHRQLARRVDIVVIHASDLHSRLLPAGRLREPLSSLRRASVIVLREEDAGLENALRAHADSACLVWRLRRALRVPGTVKRAVAFCAIARPEEFFTGLTAAGVDVVERVAFRDHHRYTSADIERVARLGQRLGCDGFITTAKDAVKLDPPMESRLDAVAPLHIAELTVVMENEQAVVSQLLSLIQS